MILFVCTGNICRSPMGEALLRHSLTAAGADHPVASAGTHAMDGGPATGHGIEVLGDRGIDLTGHLSRHLNAEIVDGADLIALGQAPGPGLGELLGDIRNRQLAGELTTREQALAWARDVLS